MPKDVRGEEQMKLLANKAEPEEAAAPSRLKARIYSALMLRQKQTGQLLGLPEVKEAGRKLCVFEQLVQIAAVGATVQSVNYCRVCHARVLAENFEHPPIYWSGCPYVALKKT